MSLRELRVQRGLTQQQLADRVPGVNRSRIAAWETGERAIGKMSLEVALRLCDALKIKDPRKLFDDDSANE